MGVAPLEHHIARGQDAAVVLFVGIAIGGQAQRLTGYAGGFGNGVIAAGGGFDHRDIGSAGNGTPGHKLGAQPLAVIPVGLGIGQGFVRIVRSGPGGEPWQDHGAQQQ